MKGLKIRLIAIWDLICGRNFILTALHKRGDKYICNHRDCINFPTYELVHKFTDAAILHMNEIKVEMKRQEDGQANTKE